MVMALSRHSRLNDKLVIAGEVELSRIDEVMDSIKTPVSYGMLLDKNGRILSGPNPEDKLKVISDVKPSLTPNHLEDLSATTAVGLYEMIEIYGKEYILTAFHMEELDWHLLLLFNQKRQFTDLFVIL